MLHKIEHCTAMFARRLSAEVPIKYGSLEAQNRALSKSKKVSTPPLLEGGLGEAG